MKTGRVGDEGSGEGGYEDQGDPAGGNVEGGPWEAQGWQIEPLTSPLLVGKGLEEGSPITGHGQGRDLSSLLIQYLRCLCAASCLCVVPGSAKHQLTAKHSLGT